MPTKQLIVSLFNYELDWVKDLDIQTIAYCKGNLVGPEGCINVKIPNIGRESQTYLYHIVNNWDNLADINFFMQDDAPTHRKHIGKLISYMPDNIQYYELGNRELWFFNTDHTGCVYLLKELFNIDAPHHWAQIINAMMVVSAERIKRRSLEFYEKALKISADPARQPLIAHGFERIWRYMWGPLEPYQADDTFLAASGINRDNELHFDELVVNSQ